jgi:hypothetical protein
LDAAPPSCYLAPQPPPPGHPCAGPPRDQDREAQREQQRRAAKDPSRFQRPFKATPIPKHVGERLFDAMRVDEEARRLAARVRAEMARERARERLEETWKARSARRCRRGGDGDEAAFGRLESACERPESLTLHIAGDASCPNVLRRRSLLHDTAHTDSGRRQAAAAAAYRERLMGTGPPSATATPRRHSAASLPDGDTACRPATGPQRRRPRSAAQQAWKGAPRRVNGRVVSQPVPDFASLHSAWERRLAAAKESNQRRATVPQVRASVRWRHHWGFRQGRSWRMRQCPVPLCSNPRSCPHMHAYAHTDTLTHTH